jgi:hypothetical protein
VIYKFSLYGKIIMIDRFLGYLTRFSYPMGSGGSYPRSKVARV